MPGKRSTTYIYEYFHLRLWAKVRLKGGKSQFGLETEVMEQSKVVSENSWVHCMWPRNSGQWICRYLAPLNHWNSFKVQTSSTSRKVQALTYMSLLPRRGKYCTLLAFCLFLLPDKDKVKLKVIVCLNHPNEFIGCSCHRNNSVLWHWKKVKVRSLFKVAIAFEGWCFRYLLCKIRFTWCPFGSCALHGCLV